MPRTPLTEAEIGSFRESVRKVAARLFAERGYQAVTLRGIAAELQCSPMTPYRYFPGGKAEIFSLVRAAAHERFADVQEQAAAAHGDPVERLRALGRAYLGFALEDPDGYRVMFALDQPETCAPEQLEQELRGWLPMSGALSEAVEAGALEGDPDELAHLCWAAVHGLVTLHLAGKLKLGRSLEDLVDPAIENLLRSARPAAR